VTLKHIRLELARDPEFPNGSHDRGYEFIAPLGDDGHLDAEEWQGARERCRVKRFWPHEPGYKLDKHRIVPGEYVSFREHDGVLRTFFVKSVVDLD
jgi:hypothetical protein